MTIDPLKEFFSPAIQAIQSEMHWKIYNFQPYGWHLLDLNLEVLIKVRYCFFVLWFLGLDSEGIYRVSGFSDDIEALKDSFDKGIFKETLLVYATVQLETIGLP